MSQSDVGGCRGVRFGCRRLWIVWPCLLAVTSGCMDYRWRSDFEQAEQDARTRQKHMFIFYKHWLDSDSSRMLGGEVLSDPAVMTFFQDTVNVLIENYGEKPAKYMSKFGVTSYPASVIVAPDGSYDKMLGFVAKERFIEFARQARARGRTGSATTKSAGAPPP